MKGCIAIESFVFEVVMSWGGIIGRREGILFTTGSETISWPCKQVLKPRCRILLSQIILKSKHF